MKLTSLLFFRVHCLCATIGSKIICVNLSLTKSPIAIFIQNSIFCLALPPILFMKQLLYPELYSIPTRNSKHCYFSFKERYFWLITEVKNKILPQFQTFSSSRVNRIKSIKWPYMQQAEWLNHRMEIWTFLCCFYTVCTPTHFKQFCKSITE